MTDKDASDDGEFDDSVPPRSYPKTIVSSGWLRDLDHPPGSKGYQVMIATMTIGAYGCILCPPFRHVVEAVIAGIASILVQIR